MKRLIVLVPLIATLLTPFSASAKVELRFTVWDGDEALKALRIALNDFERIHPDIRVKLENVPYALYTQKLLAQYAANVAPDVSMLEPPFFQKFARRGALLPLEQFYSDVAGFDIEDYYEPIRRAHTYQGKLYVLPRDIAPIGLIYYNKRLFDEAKVPYPDGTWTWDWEPDEKLRHKDFTWCMRELTKRNESGKVVQWGFCPAWPTAIADTVIYSQGLRYANNDEHPTKLHYTDPRIIKAFKWTTELATKRGWIPAPQEISSVLQSSSSQLFLQQKVAMFQCGIWEVPGFRKALKPGTSEFFEWDITLAPGHIDPVTGKVRHGAPTGGSGYGIFRTTKHPREAWLLTQFMAGEPGMMAMAEAGIAQPAIKSLALKAPWIPDASTPKEQQYPASRIWTHVAVESVVFEPTADYWREIKAFVDAKNDVIFSGTAETASALADGQKNAEDRLTHILRQEELKPIPWALALVGSTLLTIAILVWIYLPDKKWKLTYREKLENRVAYSFLIPWIIGMVFLTLGPMILSLVMSFADWDIITAAKWKGLGNYTEAFTEDPRFWKSLSITGIYTLFAVPLGLLGSLGLALLLNVKVRGLPLFRTLFYLPSLSSLVATALVWRKIFQAEGGLLNTVIYGSDGKGDLLGIGSLIASLTGSSGPANWLGDEKLALPAFVGMSLWGVGGGMVILLAGLQGIPQHYYEAATLDGAGPWRRFRSVTFPLLTPSLFFSLVTGVIASFQTFTAAFVMTAGGPNDSTRFYILHLYDQAFGNLRMGYASALAWILFLLIIGFTGLQFRLNKYVHYEAGTNS
jgi:multiple sugar transport system permease protein